MLKFTRLLVLLAFGDVRTEAHMPQIFASRRQARLPIGAQQSPLPIGTPHAPFSTKGRMFPDGAPECSDILIRIVRMHQQLPFTPFHLFEGCAGELPVGPVDEPVLTLSV